MKPLTKIGVLGLSLTLVLGTFGCYPSDSLTTSELDVVSTDYDPNFFEQSNPSTYYLPDSVGTIGSDEPASEPPVSEATQDFILNEIVQNMNALGWVRVFDLPQDTMSSDTIPDVVVFASAIVVRTNVSGCIPWYPGWGWNPWYPGWGWGPGYCYPSYLYSYDTGTMTIDMVSPDESDDESLARVWHVAINGLLRSNEQASRAALQKNIDQAFIQSADYLQR